MLKIGLTGSIGMGKTTTAGLFKKRGVPVHDSDAAVHDIYQGRHAARIAEAFPGVLVDGAVDRQLLAKQVLGKPEALARLEQLVHPLVSEHRMEFLRSKEKSGEKVVVLDIPLLFETGQSEDVDVILVVTAPPNVQKQRVLSRLGMTPEKFEAILSRQLSDVEKRKRAHAIIETDRGINYADGQVEALLRSLTR